MTGRPPLPENERKVAAPFRLRQSDLDKIKELGSVQNFVEIAVLDRLGKFDFCSCSKGTYRVVQTEPKIVCSICGKPRK